MIKFSVEQVDSWVFGTSLSDQASYKSSEASYPSYASIAGMFKTLVGDFSNVDWKAYVADDQHPLRAVIGGPGGDAGLLEVVPEGLLIDNELYLACPGYLLVSENQNIYSYALTDNAVLNDMGCNRLPCYPVVNDGYLTATDSHFLSMTGFNLLKQGQLPNASQIVKSSDLFSVESRLNVALSDNKTALDGMLHQNAHLVLNRCSLAVSLYGIDDMQEQFSSPVLGRLGGEGRGATVLAADYDNEFSTMATSDKGYMLVALSDCQFDGWLPPQFSKQSINGMDAYVGELGESRVTIYSSVGPKPSRVGGWDVANNLPKPDKHIVKAGTSYFIDCESPRELGQWLENNSLGNNNHAGYGRFTIVPRC